jgi:hypothetical protein
MEMDVMVTFGCLHEFIMGAPQPPDVGHGLVRLSS